MLRGLALPVKAQHSRDVRFKIDSVTLEYKGRPYAAHDLGIAGREFDVNVHPRAVKLKRWAFHIEETATPGTYNLTIRGISFYEHKERTPVGKDMVIKVVVPKGMSTAL